MPCAQGCRRSVFEFSSEEELNKAFIRFKDLADKKHEIYDEDLQAIVTDNMQSERRKNQAGLIEGGDGNG